MNKTKIWKSALKTLMSQEAADSQVDKIVLDTDRTNNIGAQPVRIKLAIDTLIREQPN